MLAKQWILGSSPAYNNRFLFLSIVLALGLSMIGANWGRVECWNLDQMAFRGVQHNGLPWGGYLKPPLHTYMNHLFVMKPVEAVMHHNFLHGDLAKRYPVQLLGVRLLTTLLFCGTVALLYYTSKEICGVLSASILSLITATSAGLLKFNHFGTADSPLLFWMMASYAMAIRAALNGKALDAALAGALAGLATADKYNGLGVAMAIPAALIAFRGWKALIQRQIWVGAVAVPFGFILGNPGAIFDTRNFVQDFLYNLYTTPVYSGETNRAGYIDFLACFPELIGWPATMTLIAGSFMTLALLCSGKLSRKESTLIMAAGAVFVFYYLTIGRFPRMADRFVLPVIPFAFLIAAPGFERIPWRRTFPTAVLAVVLAYNIFCSVELGLRFLSDPRMAAQIYAAKNFTSGSVVENSYAPNWKRINGVDVTVHDMPCATGRSERFSKIFGKNSVIQNGIEKYETKSYPADTFTRDGLKRRNPDFIAFSNQVYQFTGDDEGQRFYRSLDDGRLGYVKVYEGTWKPRLSWTYPKDVDFLVERMVILKRSPE